MRDHDPLYVWLSVEELAALTRSADLGGVESFLEHVVRELEAPKRGFPVGGFTSFPMRLPAPLRERAEDLFFRVWESRGSGKQHAGQSLLSLVGFTADPASIPFWERVVALSRPRDAVAAERREIAAAGLALTALRHPESGALGALEALTRSEHVDARTGAVTALAQLACGEGTPLVQPALGVLRRVAGEERAFAPRFLARRFLAISGEPLPPYERGDVITFEVALGRTRRTLELTADQTLEDLHDAILSAFGWDTDHLHTFALNGDLRDERFAIPAADASPFELDPLGPGGEESLEEESFPLGAMGLPAGHQFTYLYDFGDRNVFEIKVAGAHPKIPRAKYPRVTARVAKNPPQYASG